MRKKYLRIQISLLLIGVFLIIITYFYYPIMKSTRFVETTETGKNLPDPDELLDKDSTSFENIEYKGIYDLDKSFTVNSEKARIEKEDPDVVYMTKMHVILYLNDGRIVNITSDQGTYNKKTYDCFFEKNVKASDGETNIFAENLNLLATENTVKILNNVIVDYPTGSLRADKVDYDFETKYFKVSMFDEDKVKIKVLK